MKKLSSDIVLFYFFQRQFLQLCFKYASAKVIVKIGCSKYQKLFKTLIRYIFHDINCCARETATLTPIQHTVPPLNHVLEFSPLARVHTDRRRQHHMIYESKKTQFHKLLFIRIMIQKRWWWCGWGSLSSVFLQIQFNILVLFGQQIRQSTI